MGFVRTGKSSTCIWLFAIAQAVIICTRCLKHSYAYVPYFSHYLLLLVIVYLCFFIHHLVVAFSKAGYLQAFGTSSGFATFVLSVRSCISLGEQQSLAFCVPPKKWSSFFWFGHRILTHECDRMTQVIIFFWRSTCIFCFCTLVHQCWRVFLSNKSISNAPFRWGDWCKGQFASAMIHSTENCFLMLYSMCNHQVMSKSSEILA